MGALILIFFNHRKKIGCCAVGLFWKKTLRFCLLIAKTYSYVQSILGSGPHCTLEATYTKN
jgi:hypothetical protein